MSETLVLQKVLRFKELFDQGQSYFAELETKGMNQILPKIEGTIEELVVTRSAVTINGRVARKPAAKKTATTVSKAAVTSETGGRGRKPCPQCKVFVGARAQTCPKCNHAFVAGEGAAPKAPKVAGEATGQGRRAKGESLSDMVKSVLKDAANDGRRKEPSLDLAEILEKLYAKGYKSHATEKNLRVAVQARLGDLVKKGEILKSEDRKYSVKPEAAQAAVAQAAVAS